MVGLSQPALVDLHAGDDWLREFELVGSALIQSLELVADHNVDARSQVHLLGQDLGVRPESECNEFG